MHKNLEINIQKSLEKNAEKKIQNHDQITAENIIKIAQEQIKEYDDQVLQKRGFIKPKNVSDKAVVTKFSRDQST